MVPRGAHPGTKRAWDISQAEPTAADLGGSGQIGFIETDAAMSVLFFHGRGVYSRRACRGIVRVRDRFECV